MFSSQILSLPPDILEQIKIGKILDKYVQRSYSLNRETYYVEDAFLSALKEKWECILR